MVHRGPFTRVPSLPLTDESLAVVPLPSSNFQCPRRPTYGTYSSTSKVLLCPTVPSSAKITTLIAAWSIVKLCVRTPFTKLLLTDGEIVPVFSLNVTVPVYPATVAFRESSAVIVIVKGCPVSCGVETVLITKWSRTPAPGAKFQLTLLLPPFVL